MGIVKASLQYNTKNLWLQLFHCKRWMARVYTVGFLLDCAVKCHVRCKYLRFDFVLLAQQKLPQKQCNRSTALAKNFVLHFKSLSLLLLTDCAAGTLQFSVWERWALTPLFHRHGRMTESKFLSGLHCHIQHVCCDKCWCKPGIKIPTKAPIKPILGRSIRKGRVQ